MRLTLPGSHRPARTRLAALAVVVGAAGAGTALIGPGAQAASDYRVDVIFDTAKGIIPGQVLKIAGAKAGSIKDIVLTKDYKARVQLTVDGKFKPFKSNASCQILSEGLIAERFVQCDPGTADGAELKPQGGNPPTVPVQNTFVPVSFTDLFNIWRLPVRQRLSTVVASLGLGLAGKGEELNNLLRRANPTLQLVRRAVAILNRQRAQLASTIVATDRIADEVGQRRGRVRSFIVQADRVTKQTADHRVALAEGIRRLPALLDAAKPALARLDQLAVDGAPVLSDLRESAPSLRRLVGELGPFARTGTPTLRRLGAAVRDARPEIRRVRPLVALLREFAREQLPTGQLVDQLFTSLRDRGFVEGLLRMVYGFSAVLARYDTVSHVGPLTIIAQEGCTAYGSTPVAAPGCNGKYNQTVVAAPAKRASRTRGATRRSESAPAETPAAKAPTTPAAPATQLPREIKIPGLPPIKLPALPRVPKLGGGGKPAPAPSTPKNRQGAINDLLDYLLG
jgi:phospholipid/cholesterol/gamma-HCH transport system substrate-binding protein